MFKNGGINRRGPIESYIRSYLNRILDVYLSDHWSKTHWGDFYPAIQLFQSYQHFQHGLQMIRQSMHWSASLEAWSFGGLGHWEHWSVTGCGSMLVKSKPLVIDFFYKLKVRIDLRKDALCDQSLVICGYGATTLTEVDLERKIKFGDKV